MKNKEIEELLDKLKDKDWYDELDLTGIKWIELKQEETNLLLSYIEQLEKELKEEQEDNYKQSEWLVKKQKKIEQLETDYKEAIESVTWWRNRYNAVERDKKQLKNNRDKAIEYNKNVLKENWYGGYEKENAQKNIDILKGDSDV